MSMLSLKIEEEVKDLPPRYLKEVLDFIDFVKQKAKNEGFFILIRKINLILF